MNGKRFGSRYAKRMLTRRLLRCGTFVDVGGFDAHRRDADLREQREAARARAR
jgi:putative component of membrane protein insertase Oxa1/YidC/SpoIIIJ protein YidD